MSQKYKNPPLIALCQFQFSDSQEWIVEEEMEDIEAEISVYLPPKRTTPAIVDARFVGRAKPVVTLDFVWHHLEKWVEDGAEESPAEWEEGDDLDTLLAGVNEGNLHGEIDFGSPVGAEVW